MIAFVDRQGVHLNGEAVERARVDEFISSDSSRYLMVNQLPVCRRPAIWRMLPIPRREYFLRDY